MADTQKLQFSVIETEKKYRIAEGEVVYGGGIVSWGPNNDIPTLLYNCYDNSATLKSIIDGTTNYVLGDDIEVIPKWSKEINKRGDTILSLIRHIEDDLLVYGNFAIQVIWNKLGDVKELYAVDVAKCRLSEDGKKVFYSKKGWTKYGTKSVEYARFNPDKIDLNNPTQIYFYNGEGVRGTYAKAPWKSALRDVLTEIEVSNYSLNSVTNGFSARYVINFPEDNKLTDEQKDAIEDGIVSKFCGTDAAGTVALYWGEDGKKIEVSKVEADDTPEKYKAIREGARENIFVSMKATPLLFGLPNTANGFTSTEYRDSLKVYDKMVITPNRNLIYEAIDKVTMSEGCIKIIDIPLNFD